MSTQARSTPVRSTCPYCGVGCGVIAESGADGRVVVRGDPEHPANHGSLCSKGAALDETLGLDGRLLYPEIAGRRVDWETALDHVAGEFQRIIEQHGRDAVAFYVSGQLLTEDYYVANKLMKGYIGTANIDTNSRLCMASSVAGHKRAFGADIVPCSYQDVEDAELIVLVGSNTAWCHPVLYQRIIAARSRKSTRIVVVDPRFTATCEDADLHLPIDPGRDVVLFNGLLNYLRREDALDWEFIEAHTEGFSAAFTAAREDAPSIPAVAAACGLAESDVAAFYRLFAGSDRVVTLFSQGVNQSSSGTDKVNAVINCHLASGRIGKPGAGPFSITGQPNAMGGREVGGLANQLAAHMELDDPSHRAAVQRFWNAPRIAERPGLKAVDLFAAVKTGKIRALWIMATNPAVSLPDADHVRRAIAACEFVVVSDCVRDTDTNQHAEVLLPARAWGEKDGTVTNSERRISRQRAFLPAPGETRPDWWIICQVARRLGYEEAFGYRSAADIFREHAQLSGYENDGSRDFDISALEPADPAAYDALAPRSWPARGAPAEADRPFADGRFFRPNGRAAFIAVRYRPPGNAVDERYPLVLNTGRIRDQWHTMTRTGTVARLSAHRPDPRVQINPADARTFGIGDASLVRLSSAWGEAIARAEITATQKPGNVFMPMHWNDRYAPLARVDAVVNPVTDPVSGQPESKHTPVRIEPLATAWTGFLLSRDELDYLPIDVWVKVRGDGHWRYELAGRAPPADWRAFVAQLVGPSSDGEWIEFADLKTGRYRAALLVDGRLEACLFIAGRQRDLPEFGWLAGRFADRRLADRDRACLLAGKPADFSDTGPIVCSCFSVGRNALAKAIRERQLTTTDAVGELLRAGTNCGSCLPELRALIQSSGV